MLPENGFSHSHLVSHSGAFRLARYNVTAEHDVKKDFRGYQFPLQQHWSRALCFSPKCLGRCKVPTVFHSGLILLAWLMYRMSNTAQKVNIGLAQRTSFELCKLYCLPLDIRFAAKFRYVFFPQLRYMCSLDFSESLLVVTKISKEEDEIQGRGNSGAQKRRCQPRGKPVSEALKRLGYTAVTGIDMAKLFALSIEQKTHRMLKFWHKISQQKLWQTLFIEQYTCST
jgi:phosphoribosylformylglycinamidine (FGAM) synthase PurS component